MNIKFSRHARRRMKLYRIDPEDVIDYIESSFLKNDVIIASDPYILRKYKYPLKIVVAKEANSIIIVTTYPLKEGK